jgi:hypothetical protein
MLFLGNNYCFQMTIMVRGAVLGLSQDGASTNLFENLSENHLKGDLSNAATFNPPLFSLVNTFKVVPGLRRKCKCLEPCRTVDGVPVKVG